jgi:hypothetical protein
MFAHKLNLRGSEFIREGDGTSAAYASAEIPPSRINSVPQGRISPQASHHSFSR